MPSAVGSASMPVRCGDRALGGLLGTRDRDRDAGTADRRRSRSSARTRRACRARSPRGASPPGASVERLRDARVGDRADLGDDVLERRAGEVARRDPQHRPAPEPAQAVARPEPVDVDGDLGTEGAGIASRHVGERLDLVGVRDQEVGRGRREPEQPGGDVGDLRVGRGRRAPPDRRRPGRRRPGRARDRGPRRTCGRASRASAPRHHRTGRTGLTRRAARPPRSRPSTRGRAAPRRPPSCSPGAPAPKTSPCARPTSRQSSASTRYVRVRTTCSGPAPASRSAARMISRQRRACSYAPARPTRPRGGIGAVPATCTCRPATNARENPISGSNGEPDEILRRCMIATPSARRR